MSTVSPGENPLTLKVWVDFVCPFCLLAEKPLAEAIAGLNVRIDWIPFELRPYPEPTLRPEGEYLQSAWKRGVYPLAARLGVPIRLPEVSPQPYSRLAFEGLQFAKQRGRAQEYGGAVLRAFFQEGRDIGDVAVLTSIAAASGLPPEEFRAALVEGHFRDAHAAGLRTARDIGIRAVPSILVGDRLFEGVPDAAALRREIERELSSPPGT